MHQQVLKRLVERAFPVATIRHIAVPSLRLGTDADILYDLSPTASLGGDCSPTDPRLDVFKLPELLGPTLPSFDPKVVPFFSTGSLLGDCASYCSIGYDPTTPDRSPLPLMAPRLNPRRMCLDAIVFIPGYESRDLGRIIAANLLKQLPRLNDDGSIIARDKSYVSLKKSKDARAYEEHGLRVLSDCIEIVVDANMGSRECTAGFVGERAPVDTGADISGRRTMFVGFANPAWSASMINRSINEEERSARRAGCGVSRETLRRSLPRPIIEASRQLSSYSKTACAGTRLELPPMFWLHVALLAACAKKSQADPIISEAVLAAVAGPQRNPPPRSPWEHSKYNRRVSWDTLLSKQPVTSLTSPFHFELVTDDEKNRMIGASLAQVAMRFMRPNSFPSASTILPQESYLHPGYRAAVKHVISVAQQRPPNFLASLGAFQKQ